MKTFYVEITVPDTTPDPIVDGSRIAPDALATLAAADGWRYLLSDKDIRDRAENLAAREYRDTVQGIADDLRRAIADGEVTDTDGANEWLEQTIDGHHDVIYTSCAMEVCRQSSNDSAYF